MKKYLGTDTSINVIKLSPVHDKRHVGKLGQDHTTKWKVAGKGTIEILLAKGALNQSQIDKLEAEGVDVYSVILKLKLESLNLDREKDFVEFVKISAMHPQAIKIMDKITDKRKKDAAKQATKNLESKISRMNLNTAGGIKAFGELVKNNPEALNILEKMNAKK